MFSKHMKADWFFLLVILVLAIFIRSLNFTDSLNFSTDQAKFSIEALEILRGENDGMILIGPPISLQLEGRKIYQGGVIYYFQALFLSLGNLDPVVSSYLFMAFSVLMAIPLYFGIKFLTNSEKAKLVTIFYCLTPIFINYTKFLWNPNFQLSLSPLLFLFLGLQKKSGKIIWLFVAGVWFGIIFQFHYQLFIGGLILLGYLKFYLKTSLPKILLFIFGVMIGFLPIIFYEMNHRFVNFQTLLYYLQNFNQFQKANSDSNFFANQHYFLSLILIILIVIVSFMKVLNLKLVYGVAAVLIILDLFLYLPKPTQGFGMANSWKYEDEARVFELIKEQKMEGYNVTNLGYDTLAQVQKYLHKKDKIEERLSDYWETRNMFVIAPKAKDIYNDQTYEIQVVKPFKVIKEWEINPEYKLYLLQKV